MKKFWTAWLAPKALAKRWDADLDARIMRVLLRDALRANRSSAQRAHELAMQEGTLARARRKRSN